MSGSYENDQAKIKWNERLKKCYFLKSKFNLKMIYMRPKMISTVFTITWPKNFP